MRDVDEKSLLKELNDGDYQAFTVLYDLYWEDLFLYVQRIVNNENDAKDLVQETFLAIWNLKGKLEHVNSFKAYSLTIARHKALRYIRENTHRTELVDDFISFLKDHEPNALDHLITNELALFVDNEVDKLPERMREVFKKSRDEGLSNKEIAQHMGISDQTVKKQINYSLKYLRFRISQLHCLLTFYFFL